jgi:hypothetical protein
MGQHLNLSGKEQIFLRLAAVIRNFFNKKHLVPFSMPWKEVPSTAHQETNSDCFNNYTSKTEIRGTPSEEIGLDSKDGMVKQCQLSN